MDYSVKNIKTFHGHDGGCWEATLYNPKGKRVAIVTEDGWGGGLQFHWLNFAHKNNANADSIALDVFCKTLPQWELYDGEMTDTDADVYLGGLVEAKLVEKEVKKMLKKVAIFDDGKIFTYKIPASDLDRAMPVILKQRPTAVFLNSLGLSEAVEIYQQAA
tara:strand:+ start:764 stop:1246 length:483 start_codon:yes stop_codon:yes gene_type:complete